MHQALTFDQISAVFERERPRLWNFIRQRVSDTADAEDILQEVFYELFEAQRLTKPIEQTGAWLFRVARNRVIDLFRRKKPERLPDDSYELESLLPSPEAGPDALYARSVLLEELNDALNELPPEQREAFLANEVEGLTFRELSERTGVNLRTLLSRKRYAVLHLRKRLQLIYDEYLKG